MGRWGKEVLQKEGSRYCREDEGGGVVGGLGEYCRMCCRENIRVFYRRVEDSYVHPKEL